MPTEIVTETCPAPECNLTEQDIEQFLEELTDYLLFGWVTADELYGDSPAFRDGVAELNKWYITEIICTTSIWSCRLICLIARPSWHDQLLFQPTLRCNTSFKALCPQVEGKFTPIVPTGTMWSNAND